MNTIAAFDFDGTLIACDSLPMFLKAAEPRRSRRMLAFALSLPWMVAAAFCRPLRGRAKEALISFTLNGKSPEQIDNVCHNLADKIEQCLRPELAAKLDEYTSTGAKTVIVSASCTIWIKPWASRRGIEVIATEMQPDSRGRWRFVTPNCVGNEKVHRFLEAYPDRDTYTLHVYGDSTDDLPLMSIADESFMV